MVPTLDGGERFLRCLAALEAQRPALDALVVVDSGSRDGSAEAAARAGAQVLDLGGQPFDHGLTRNRGAAALPAVDVVVFLVQDAIPQGADCLETLARAALLPGVAGARARQLPPPQASALTRASVQRAPQASQVRAQVGPFDREARARFTPQVWQRMCVLDDVACAVRSSLFSALGYPAASFGEDALLSHDLLSAGWALVHEPDAVVEHGHEYTPNAAGARYEQDARFFRERFGLVLRPSGASVLRGLLVQLLADYHWATAHPDERTLKLFLQALKLRWATVTGQRRGSRGSVGVLPAPRSVFAPPEVSV